MRHHLGQVSNLYDHRRSAKVTEAAGLDRNRVGAGFQQRRFEVPAAIRRERLGRVGSLIANGDRGAGDDGSGGVEDRAADTTLGRGLRVPCDDAGTEGGD